MVGLLRTATSYAHKAANAERGGDVRAHLDNARAFGMAADHLTSAMQNTEARAAHLTLIARAVFQKCPGTDAEGTALRRVVDALLFHLSPAEIGISLGVPK
jgi:hypothetical protein